MTRENVEIVREAFDVINAYMREEASAGALAGLFDPQLDWFPSDDYPHGDEGAVGFLAWLEENREPVDELTLEPHEFIEVGEHVVVPLTVDVVGRGRSEVQTRVTWTWTVRHGAIERLRMYKGRDEALEAAGRPE
jgi:ketosteroid isomerase-like protein